MVRINNKYCNKTCYNCIINSFPNNQRYYQHYYRFKYQFIDKHSKMFPNYKLYIPIQFFSDIYYIFFFWTYKNVSKYVLSKI